MAVDFQMTKDHPIVVKSKWGFYPCPREDCLLLKEAHKLLLRAYKDCKRHIRWNAKDPHNRKGPEPKAPKDFIEFGYHRLDEREFYGYGFKNHGRENLYLHVLRQYRRARYPVERSEDVVQLDLPNIYGIVDTLGKFYAE